MKKILLSVSLIGIFFLVACDKSEDDPAPSSTSSGFTWTENSSTTVTADSAYYDSNYKTIKAFKGGSVHFIEINLMNDSIQAHAIGSGNAVSYLTSGDLYSASAGSVSITSLSTLKMSGSFTTTGSGAGITALSGTFADIQVR